jgi:hypothetical protein
LPDRIALTGGTAEAGQVLLDACRRRFEQIVGDYHREFMTLMPGIYQGVEIVLGTTRSETGVIGAVIEIISNV